ncbi:MAG: glycosyltransferase family 4 protein [Bacteroidales bacterium]|nr:glycosyltransferase family 4 protein [Bacteroidales bacterium]
MDIYYFKTSNSSFILTDKNILEKHFSVETYHINNKNGKQYVIALLKLLLFLLTKGKKARIYFIRFADWHTALIAFFKIIYRKKLVIVVGGFDAFHFPAYAYGVYHRKFRGWCAKYALRNASLILPNSPCLIEYTNNFASSNPIKGGIRFFEPRIKSPIKVIYNGFDTAYWATTPSREKKDIVMTVAIVNNMNTFYLKGIDSFILLACQMPEVSFKMVGVDKIFLSRNHISTPENLEIIDLLPHPQLLDHYQTAKVFCIFSLTEGMSNVLCEAMLCECIPVGSNVTFIPEIIGDTGFIVYHKAVDEMKQQVGKALQSDAELGKKAKKRIMENYALGIREKSLTETILPMLTYKSENHNE